MFIKIVRKGRESVFECNRYSMWEMGSSPNENLPNRIMFEIRGKTDMDHEIPKDKNTEVYILNDMGKTIDTYRWG